MSRLGYSPPAITASFEQRRTIHGAIRRFQELLRFHGSVLKQRIRDSGSFPLSLSLSLPFSQFRTIQLVPTLATFALNRANETSRNFYHLSYPTRASLPNNEVNLSADQRIPLFFFLFVKRQSAKGSILLAVKTFINAASNVFSSEREG